MDKRAKPANPHTEHSPFGKWGALDRNTIPRRFGLHHNIDKLLHSGKCNDQSSGTERLGMEKIASYMYDSAVQPSQWLLYVAPGPA